MSSNTTTNPRQSKTEGSTWPVRAGGEHMDCPDSRHSWLFLLSGTLVWDGSDPTKNLRGHHDAWEEHFPLWNCRGKAEPPAEKPLPLGFLRPSSRIPAEKLLLRARNASQGSLPWEHFQGTLPGRCRCSLTALSTGCHRPLPGSHRGTREPGSRGERENLPVPSPPGLKPGTNRLGNTTPQHGFASPHPRGAVRPPLPPGSARPSGSPDPRPPDSSDTEPPHPRTGQRDPGRGARGQHQRSLIPGISGGDPARGQPRGGRAAPGAGSAPGGPAGAAALRPGRGSL